MWDLRKLDAPVSMQVVPRHVTKLQWCPTRPALLAISTKDCQRIRLVDVQQTVLSQEEVEPFVMERDILCPPTQTISSMTWNPHLEDSMLMANTNGGINEIAIMARLTLAWNRSDKVIVVNGNSICELQALEGWVGGRGGNCVLNFK